MKPERECASNLTSYLNNAKLNKVDTSKWKEFKVKEIFITEKRESQVKYQQAHLFQKDICSMEKHLELVLQILTTAS